MNLSEQETKNIEDLCQLIDHEIKNINTFKLGHVTINDSRHWAFIIDNTTYAWFPMEKQQSRLGVRIICGCFDNVEKNLTEISNNREKYIEIMHMRAKISKSQYLRQIALNVNNSSSDAHKHLYAVVFATFEQSYFD